MTNPALDKAPAVIASASMAKLIHGLSQEYPNGPPDRDFNNLGTRDMVIATIDQVSWILKNESTNIRLGIEWDARGRRNGLGNATGLIVLCDDVTKVFPLAISAGLVRIGQKPIFLAHEKGAEILLREIEGVIGLVASTPKVR